MKSSSSTPPTGHGLEIRIGTVRRRSPLDTAGDGLGQALEDSLRKVHGGLGHGLIGDLGGAVGQASTRHPIEPVPRGAGLLELLQDDRGVDRDGPGALGSAHVRSHQEVVLPGLDDPGAAMPGAPRVVVVGQSPQRDLERDLRALAGIDDAGAPVGDELASRGGEQPLGRLRVDLDHRGPGALAGIGHMDADPRSRLPGIDAVARDLEGGVAQTEAEGELHRLGSKGLEIAVADEDVLDVVVGLGILEA